MAESSYSNVRMSGSFWRVTVPAMACVMTFILWASLFPIDEMVRGRGKVITSGQNRVIDHLEGGIISDILVREGQQVEKGQLLIRLSNQGFNSDSQEVSIELLAAEVRRIRLRAELEGKETLEFPDHLKAQVGLQEINRQRQLFSSRTQQYQQSIDVLQQQVRQKQLKIDELQQKARNVSSEMQVAREQYDVAEKLYERGAYSKNRYLDTKSNLRRFITDLRSIQSSIPTIQAELEETRRRIEEARNEHRSTILEEMNTLKVTIDQLQERSKNFTDRVSRTEIFSPVKGIINTVHVNTIGSVVKSGEPILEITPLNDALVIEAEISAKDRARVWPGQASVIQISAFDYTIHGTLDGTLSTISADSMALDNGEQVYRVRITPAATTLNGQDIIPGMVADANILTGKRTIMSYLLKPLTRMRQNVMIEP